MWRKLFVVAALLAVPTMAYAQFEAGNFELTLSANAVHGPDLDGLTAGAQGSIGYFLTKEMEVAVRQSLNYSDIVASGGSAWQGSTVLALDWHFDLGKVVPFIGVNAGYLYGDGIDDDWIAGPEAGVKVFLSSSTFIQLLVQYEFLMCDGFSGGQFVYTLGLGFKW